MMFKNRFCQASVEFILLLSIVMVFFLAFFSAIDDRSKTFEYREKQLEAKNIAELVGTKINEIHLAGNNASTRVHVPVDNEQRVEIFSEGPFVQAQHEGGREMYPLLTDKVEDVALLHGETIIENVNGSIYIEGVRLINNWYDLNNTRKRPGGEYRLMTDLDSSSKGYNELVDNGDGWTPIGDDGKEFAGIFDGQDNSIEDLFVEEDGDSAGLFAETRDSEIKNLILVNPSIDSDGDALGGLVGNNRGDIYNVVIENPYINVDGMNNDWFGGLVGRHASGTINNSHVIDAEIEGGGYNNFGVGGLAGYINSEVTRSSVVDSDLYGVDIGGLAGNIAQAGLVTESFVKDTYIDGSGNAGGFVGGRFTGEVEDSYTSGVIVEGGSRVGGFVGFSGTATDSGDVTNSFASTELLDGGGGFTGNHYSGSREGCFFDINVSSETSNCNAEGTTNEEMKNITTYEDVWGIETVDWLESNEDFTWNIVNGETYPFLSWEQPPVEPYDEPQIMTKNATNITFNSATLNANINEMGDIQEGEVYFEWREKGTETWSHTSFGSIDSTGNFSAELENLESLQDYEFRTIMEYSYEGRDNFVKGQVKNFTTYFREFNLTVLVEDEDNDAVENAIVKFNGTEYKENLTDGDGEITKTLYEGNYTIHAKKDELHGRKELSLDKNKTAAIIVLPPITDWYELNESRKQITGYYHLGNNLNSSSDGYDELVDNGNGWDPIGDKEENFSVVFDGRGHSIEDLSVEGGNSIGLFGVTDGSEIKNLILVNPFIASDGDVLGGLVGTNEGDISNVVIESPYINVDGMNNDWFGGLAGRHEKGTISDSHVIDAEIEGGGYNNFGVGGLAGYINSEVTRSSVVDSDLYGEDIGGLAGNIAQAGLVTESFVKDTYIDGSGDAGGFVGGRFTGEVEDSYTSGVIVDGGSRVGGFVGYSGTATDSGDVTNSFASTELLDGGGGFTGYHYSGSREGCFFDINVSSETSNCNAEGTTNEEMKNITTYEDIWSITSVNYWERDERFTWNIFYNMSYPILSWEPREENEIEVTVRDSEGNIAEDAEVIFLGPEQKEKITNEEGIASAKLYPASYEVIGFKDGFAGVSQTELYEDKSLNLTLEMRVVEDWEDLYEIRHRPEEHYILANDLDNSTQGYDRIVDDRDGWEPIGNSEYAIEFDGSEESHIEAGTDGIRKEEGTIEFHFKINEYPDYDYRFIGHVQPENEWNNRLFMGIHRDDHEFYIGLGDEWELDTGIFSPELEKWYHAALVYENGEYVVYINGEEKSSGTYSGLDEIHETFDIGNSGNIEAREYGINGSINNVRWWSEARTQENISETMEPGRIINEETLVGYWKMNEGEGEIVTDVSDNENHGLLTGGDWKNIVEPFQGSFDGYGNLIKDLQIDKSNYDRAGLFGEVEGAKIRNLGVVDANVTARNHVGILSGEVNETEINEVFASGIINGEDYVGGLAGLAIDSVFKNTYSNANVSGINFVGGLIGINEGNIYNSHSQGPVSGDFGTGGLIGSNEGNIDESYWNIDKSDKESSDGGMGLTDDEMKDLSTFEPEWNINSISGFDKDNEYTWNIVNGKTYPFLSNVKEPMSLFVVESIETYDPIVAGVDDLLVTASLKNTGSIDDTQTIELIDFDGNIVYEETLTLEPGEERTIDLVWNTTEDDFGEDVVTVQSYDDSESDEVLIEEPFSDFEVEILETNEPIIAGVDDLLVTAGIENTGNIDDTQTVELIDFDGNIVYEETLTLEPGEEKTIDLIWNTTEDDFGEDVVTIQSYDDSESDEVLVEEPLPFFEVEILETNEPVEGGLELSVNALINNTGNVEDTQTIELLDFDGDVVDDKEKEIGVNENEVIELIWHTQEDDAGIDDITVQSEDTDSSREVIIEHPDDCEDRQDCQTCTIDGTCVWCESTRGPENEGCFENIDDCPGWTDESYEIGECP